jgi:hypothetical protein
MTKYLSVDTETSGLDPDKSELLEVGIVVFDTEDSELVLTSYNSLRIVFVKEQIQGNIFAINMNINLLNEILTMSKEFDKLDTGTIIEKVSDSLTTWYVDIRRVRLLDTMFLSNYLDEDNQVIGDLTYKLTAWLSAAKVKGKLNVAGKNFAMFDKAFLEKFSCFRKVILRKMSHKVLDIGSMYVSKEDKCLPSLDECLQKAGINEAVPHNAVDDARLTALAALFKLK